MSGPKNLEDLKKFKLKIEVESKYSNLKDEYKSVVELIKLDIGSLEEIRHQLSLSRRQICKLLLVDPSAWTRWTRIDDDAPPHIYQALHWYMKLKDQNPEIHAPLHLENKFDQLRKDADLKLNKMQLQVKQLEAQKQLAVDPVYKFSNVLSENFKALSEALLQSQKPIDIEVIKQLLIDQKTIKKKSRASIKRRKKHNKSKKKIAKKPIKKKAVSKKKKIAKTKKRRR